MLHISLESLDDGGRLFLKLHSYDYSHTFSLFIFSSTFSPSEYRLVVACLDFFFTFRIGFVYMDKYAAQCLIEIKLKRLSK